MLRNSTVTGRTSGTNSRRLAAVVLVAITLLAIVIPLFLHSESAQPDDSTTHDVVYHLSYNNTLITRDGSEISVDEGYNTVTALDATQSVTYRGSIVSTEYNPQMWDYNRWYSVTNYSSGNTVVFTGWVYPTSVGNGEGFTDPRYPGEVMSESEMEDAADERGTIHIYATWARVVNVVDGMYLVGTSGWIPGGDEYTNIVLITGDGTLSRLSEDGGGVTIRGTQPGTRLVLGATEYHLNQNVIVDNFVLDASHTANHGDGDGGILANGHVLVIGTGMSSTGSNLTGDYTQIFGGSSNRSITSEVVTRTPYGYDREMGFGTFLIIHSGTYGNVVAGSRGMNIDASDADALSTYLVIRDVTVLDTLVGGNGSMGNSTINGSCFTYAYGLRMYGDLYEESSLYEASGEEDYTNPIGVQLTESTILTGGSNNGTVTGNTRVYLAGDSEVWDVQAGGRRGSSQVQGTASLEISGDAIVKHVACGSITDGNENNPGVRSVVASHITVRDNAMVGSVFGAGFDSYASVTYASMFGEGSTITIDVQGGTVGYVYGGGYRGSVGYDPYIEAKPIDSVTINISGGAVLGDVFGGGRGGVDKPIHDASGNLNRSWSQSGLADSTGMSLVYAKTVNIHITGGTVYGDVFGGGESVPKLDGTITYSNGTSDPFYSGPTLNADDVASVVTDTVNIRIGDCTVAGSVYGAGKGVFDLSDVDLPGVYAIGIDPHGSPAIHRIPWYSGSDSELEYDTDYRYSGFASMTSDDISIRFENYRSNQDPDLDPERNGSIYGGGMYGTTDVTGTVSIYVLDSSVAECIYGGGRGDESGYWPGEMTSGTIRIEVNTTSDTGGTIVSAESTPYSVFGGGQNARTSTGAVIILLNGNSELTGDVHAGAMGTEGAGNLMAGDRYVVLNGASVFGSIYGGSRFSQDSDAEDFDSATIMLVSGTVTQAVYGGGFQGTSYIDSTIYAGTPAIRSADELLSVTTAGASRLWVNSIYGGGNLTLTDNQTQPYTRPLLMGSSEIEIGMERGYPGYDASDEFLHIEGDVFGHGNYSTVGGSSVIWIHDVQTSESNSIRSIQRADELYIVNSVLHLTGSADGGEEGLTERYSIIRTDLLQLDRSTLHLYSETSNIKEYRSTLDGALASRESCSVEDTGAGDETQRNRNQIVLHEGRPFTLVSTGTGNVPTAIGTVHGYTLLSKQAGDPYYGLYAMGMEDVDVETGFMVRVENDDGTEYYEEAHIIDTDISVDGEDVTLRTWYLAGHLTLGQQLTFYAYPSNPPDGYSRTPTQMSIQLPRFDGRGDSVYTYIGGYVDPTLQDGLYLVSESDHGRYQGTDDERRSYIYATLGGVSLATHHLEGGTNDSWTRNLIGTHEPIENANVMTLTTDLLSQKGSDPGSVGDLGTITIHLTESLVLQTETSEGTAPQYIPINMIDIVLNVHVKPYADNPVDIFVTVLSTYNASTGRYEGVSYINLPAGGTSEALTYWITDISSRHQKDDGSYGDLEDNLTLWSDTSHLGQSGWTVIRYTSNNPYDCSDYSRGDRVYIGEGGIRDTTIAFEYKGGMNGFLMTIVDENDTIYNITVSVQVTNDVFLDIAFDELVIDDDGTVVRGDRYHLVSLPYDDGAEGDGTMGRPFLLGWHTDDASGMRVPYGTVLDSDIFYFRMVLENGSQSDSLHNDVMGLIEVMLGQFDDMTIGDVTFSYADHFDDLFVDPDFLTRYNPGSELKESMTLYASFGLTVTFHGQGVTVRPQTVIVQPGQTLGSMFNNIDAKIDPVPGEQYTGIDVWDGTYPIGMHPSKIPNDDGEEVYSWAYRTESDTEPYRAFDFTRGVYTDLDLYLVWEPDRYTAYLEFENGDSTLDMDDLSGLTVLVDGSETEYDWEDGCVVFGTHYGASVSITPGNLSDGSDGRWIVTGIIPTHPEGIDIVTVTGLNTGTVSLLVPDADGNGSDIRATIELENGHTLIMEYQTQDGDPIAVGDTLWITVAQGDREETYGITFSSNDATFPMIGNGDVTLTVMYESSGSTATRTLYWSFDVADGDHTVNGPDVRGKTQSGLTLSTPACDVTVEIATYTAVELESWGTGIGSITVEDPDGGTLELTTSDSRIVFSGEVLRVTASSGYFMPPADTSGVRPMDGDQSYMDYEVTGIRNVVFGALQSVSVDIRLSIALRDSTGSIDAGSGTIRQFLTTVIVNGSTRPMVVEYTEGVGTATVEGIPYNGSGYDANVRIDGFRSPSTDVHLDQETGSSTVHGSIDLQLITYRIIYHGSSTSSSPIETGTGSLTEWSVLSPTKTAICYLADGGDATAVGRLSDGSTQQIWIVGERQQDGTFRLGGFASSLHPLAFDSNDELHLFALDRPQGDFTTEGGTNAPLIVIVREGNLEGTYVTQVETDRFGTSGTVTFTSSQIDGAMITYNTGTHALTLIGIPPGSGALRFFSDEGYSIMLYVFADASSEIGGVTVQ